MYKKIDFFSGDVNTQRHNVYPVYKSHHILWEKNPQKEKKMYFQLVNKLHRRDIPFETK